MLMDYNISQWLKSGEYQIEIDSVLTNIIRNSELSKSEAETSAVFENEIYYFMRKKFGIELHFYKETPIEGIVHTFDDISYKTSGRGRLDAVVNNLIIEYKHNSKLFKSKDKEKAFEQVKDYLMAIYAVRKEKYDAILTDGLCISYFSFVGEEVHHTALRTITTEDIDTIIKAILNNKSKKFEPKNIVADFSISPLSDSVTKNVANILFSELDKRITDKSDMLYEEWKCLMHLSVDDNGKSNDIEKRRNDLSKIFSCSITDAEREYKAIYALQTTYAIIVKLIACKVVDNLNYNAETNDYHDLLSLNSSKMQRFFQRMEDGYSYSNMGIRNFLEGDFFSWYADEGQWGDSLYKEFQKLISDIDYYSAFSLNVRYAPIDIFKDLYMSIIPQSIRHSMGEYFTPEWLADCVVSRATEYIETSQWKAIDPCCGSGIFIISLIKKLVGNVSLDQISKKDKKKLLDNILGRVYGIDINPLSVLSARVSYYLAIYGLGDVKDVEIPVYLGDSAITPVVMLVDGIECYFYSVNNLKCGSFEVVLPRRFVKQLKFGETMNKLQALVKAESSSILTQVLVCELTEEEKNSEMLIAYIQRLSESLVYLHENKWDGIWIRIVTNFMLIARLDSFDMIVGNPPWVKWEHLPAAYTKKIKEFCDVKHIFCNDGGLFGGAQLNICALIANVTATNWLNKDGVLAFLMPDSIMAQNSYEEFRNFYTDYTREERMYLQSLDRWMSPLRPFKVGKKSVMQDFNTYYYSSKKVDYTKGVPVRIIGKGASYSDDGIGNCDNFSDAARFLAISRGWSKQLSGNSTAFTYISDAFNFDDIIGDTSYRYRTGVESTPFEVFKLTGEGKSETPGHYRFKNKVLKTSKYKVDDIPDEGWELPVEYVYPMVEGPAIQPFQYSCENSFHIVPYDVQNPKEPVAMRDLLERNQKLAIYFANQKHLLDMQSDKSKTMHRGSEFYALSKIGPYTFAPYMVAARDNSKFCASVIYPTLAPWGELKHSVCVKHTIIISQDINGKNITEDEAHYINGILNSSIVKAYIHSTFKTNGFSLNKSHLFMPKYDAGDELCVRISNLSKEATDNKDKREEITDLLTTVYLELCRQR